MKKIERAPLYEAVFSNAASAQRIMKIVFNAEFNELINRINENCYYWDKVKYLPTIEDSLPIEVWAIAKLRRKASPFKVQFGEYRFTWFLNSKIQELLHRFDLNIGGSLESRSLIPKDEKNRYLVSSIMEEAIASSQIEGAVTTRKQAKEMLRKNKPPRNKSEQMIFNNYKTIQKILEIKDEDISMDKILEIHRLVSNNTLSHRDEEGAFRKGNDINIVDVTDGNIVYTPPHFDKIEILMNDLCIFFNKESKDEAFIHPIIKGCIIHFMIGFIHPFVDGNGRTARALFYWYLLKKGYWLTEYLSISKLILKSKTQYAKAYIYTEMDENDLTYFINYKLKTMDLAFQSLRVYIQKKLEEKKQVSEFIKIKGVNDRQALILKWYYEEDTLLLTVKELETRLSISNQTARTDLQGLVNLRFLTSIQINLKTEAFIKSEAFDNLLRVKLKTDGKSS